MIGRAVSSSFDVAHSEDDGFMYSWVHVFNWVVSSMTDRAGETWGWMWRHYVAKDQRLCLWSLHWASWTSRYRRPSDISNKVYKKVWGEMLHFNLWWWQIVGNPLNYRSVIMGSYSGRSRNYGELTCNYEGLRSVIIALLQQLTGTNRVITGGYLKMIS